MTKGQEDGAPSVKSKVISGRMKRQLARSAIARPCDLTYIASIDVGCKQGSLEALEMSLFGKCSWRYIFASPQFLEWMNSEMLAILPQFEESGSMKEQLKSELFGFLDGIGLALGSDFRCLEPIGSAVWELKTPDMRLFGWFPALNYFVLHQGAPKQKLLKRSQYTPFIKEVERFRMQLKNFVPNYVAGGAIKDVVSNRIRPF